jgi:hypothetical protein
LLLSAATAATAQNVLTNPGFESGPLGAGVPVGWVGGASYGVVSTEAAHGCLVPLGNQLCNLRIDNGSYEYLGYFYCFGGSANIEQDVLATEGGLWGFSCNVRYCSGAPTSDMALTLNLSFLGAGDVQIGGVQQAFSGVWGFPADTWYSVPPLTALAPPGTMKVRVGAMMSMAAAEGQLCPGGDAQLEDFDLRITGPDPTLRTSWGRVKTLYR